MDNYKKVDTFEEVLAPIDEAERRHPKDHPLNITGNITARHFEENEFKILWKKNLKLIQKFKGSRIEFNLNNHFDWYSIDKITIEPNGDDYSYSVHTREYNEDYTYESIEGLEELLDVLVLACCYGKNLKFITEYNYKKEAMIDYSKALMNGNISVEFDTETINLSKPITMDEFILNIVPRVIFLSRVSDNFIITNISYKFDVHPNGVEFIQSKADEDSDDVIVEIATIDLGTYTLVQKKMSFEEALEVWWTVLVKESIPDDFDSWKDITYKGGAKVEE